MESDLLDAWSTDLYWICLKYDLDPTDDEVRNMVEEVFELAHGLGYDRGVQDYYAW